MLKKADGEGGEDDDSDSSNEDGSDADDDIPLVCQSCREKWEECTSIPIQTVCGHYFCEDCAMSNYARTPKCMVCDAPTNGIFNSCNALEDKIKQKKDRQAEAKQKKRLKISDPFNASLED